MVIFYKIAGVIALFGLCINMIILLGTMAVFDATLTMPGIAGIVLTIGIAIDANVLIFERLKEELKRGKPFGSAIRAAYDKHTDFENRFSHIYWKDSLSHYRLLIEYRFTGELMHDAPGYARRNSGVMIHSQAPETMPKDQNFPI